MIADFGVRVKNVSKSYRLFPGLRKRIVQTFSPSTSFQKEFQALSKVSVDFPRGKTSAIIGHNGSGKTTLLRLIGSVLKPSSGSIETSGEVSALMSLNTGFHMELTGVENIQMVCAMEGFSKAETVTIIQQVREFSELGDFLNRPVKTYSSGMYSRLGFSLSMMSQPDIVLIDEIFSVGDTKFQRKCFRKLQDMKDQGKTIIMVTHDLDWVSRYSDYVVFLEKGRVRKKGTPKETLYDYLSSLDPSLQTNHDSERAIQDVDDESFADDTEKRDLLASRSNYNPAEYRRGNLGVSVIDFEMRCKGSIDPVEIEAGDQVVLTLKVLFNRLVDHPVVGFAVKNAEGMIVYGTNTLLSGTEVTPGKPQEVRYYQFEFPLDLKEGGYFLDLGCESFSEFQDKHRVSDMRWDVVHFRVRSEDSFTGVANFRAAIKELKRTPGRGKTSVQMPRTDYEESLSKHAPETNPS